MGHVWLTLYLFCHREEALEKVKGDGSCAVFAVGGMCIHCDSLAPICRWRAAKCLDDYFAGWDEDQITIDQSADDEEAEFCKICQDTHISYEADFQAPEADPEEPAKRLAIFRPGMTPPNPQTPPRVAPWDPMRP